MNKPALAEIIAAISTDVTSAAQTVQVLQLLAAADWPKSTKRALRLAVAEVGGERGEGRPGIDDDASVAKIRAAIAAGALPAVALATEARRRYREEPGVALDSHRRRLARKIDQKLGHTS